MTKSLDYYMALDYTIKLFYSQEDKRWYASIDELAGTLADGATIMGAINRLHKVKQEYIEVLMENGDPIPEPPRR